MKQIIKVNIFLFEIVFFLLISHACTEKKPTSKSFNFTFSEAKMVINQEQNNAIEGTYLKIYKKNNKKLIINIPDNFIINLKNYKKWHIGWGKDTKLLDNGCENIRKIETYNPNNKSFELGTILRGNGIPKIGQRIVFWNFNSDGFKKISDRPIINPKQWKNFEGQSISFAKIIFDPKPKKWFLFFQECDSKRRSIYCATSSDLKKWTPLNGGNPILTYSDFSKLSWCSINVQNQQTPFLNEIIYRNKKWHFYFSGINRYGINEIGFAVSNHLTHGFSIRPNAILSAGYLTAWNNRGCFNPKITQKGTTFLMAFDGVNDLKEENTGLALSNDLIHWKVFPNNPVIHSHTGWRSKPESSEPNYIEWKNDSILLCISGTKKLKLGFYHHYISKQMYKGISGNTDDAQLGIYLSTDNGKTFYPHKNNPVIINNYTDPSENEHMGGNIQLIQTDSVDYFFYQAKNSKNKNLKYSIYLKTKVKK